MASVPNPEEILQQIAAIAGGVAAPAAQAVTGGAAAPAPGAAPAYGAKVIERPMAQQQRLAPGTDFLRELFERSHGGMGIEEYARRLQEGTAPTPTRIGPRRQRRIFDRRLRDYIAAGAPEVSEEFAWRVRNQDPAMMGFLEEVRRRQG